MKHQQPPTDFRHQDPKLRLLPPGGSMGNDTGLKGSEPLRVVRELGRVVEGAKERSFDSTHGGG